MSKSFLASAFAIIVLLLVSAVALNYLRLIGANSDSPPVVDDGAHQTNENTSGAVPNGGAGTRQAGTHEAAVNMPKTSASSRGEIGAVAIEGRPAAPGSNAPGIGRSGTAPKGAALFPDGTWLPPLNGVKDAGPIGWPRDKPYSPVVRIYRDPKTGMEWYIHANGTRSTVQMVQVQRGGRVTEEPGWAVGHKTRALPVHVPKRQ